MSKVQTQDTSLSGCVANEENGSPRTSIHVAYGVYDLSINVDANKKKLYHDTGNQLKCKMEKQKKKISEVMFTGSARTPSPILSSILRIKDPLLEDSSFVLTWPICKETSSIHHQSNKHDQNWILYMTSLSVQAWQNPVSTTKSKTSTSPNIHYLQDYKKCLFYDWTADGDHAHRTDKTARWNGILQTIPVQLLLPRQQKESRLH